jgi:hypothetical protein
MRALSTLAALAIAGACVPALAQTTTSPGTAATTTGTTTSQQEMNRGVPGVDVDVGRNARGAVDVDVDRKTNVRNAPGARDTTAPAGTRPARADRG